MSKITIEDVLKSGPYSTGGKIISGTEAISDNEYIIHCYDGQRYKLVLTKFIPIQPCSCIGDACIEDEEGLSMVEEC